MPTLPKGFVTGARDAVDPVSTARVASVGDSVTEGGPSAHAPIGPLHHLLVHVGSSACRLLAPSVSTPVVPTPPYPLDLLLSMLPSPCSPRPGFGPTTVQPTSVQPAAVQNDSNLQSVDRAATVPTDVRAATAPTDDGQTGTIDFHPSKQNRTLPAELPYTGSIPGEIGRQMARTPQKVKTARKSPNR